jgi:uncharacterized Zn finger protein
MPWQPWDDYPPPSRPIRVRGGIRAHAQRGKFVSTWWADRWLTVLESLEVGGRLGRGRSYARSGQVLTIGIGKGLVDARVQGSRPRPYDVTINVKPLTAAQWRKVVGLLAEQAGYAARLLAGEMPQDIEQVFQAAGVSLFPTSYKELRTKCSCPDDANPCKHIAAVYYLIGEEFDRDPFLIFTLRGLAPDELTVQLAELSPAADAPLDEPAVDRTPPSAELVRPLTAESFWQPFSTPPLFFGEVAPPGAPEALLQRFGRFSFWRGETPLLDALTPQYGTAVRRALDLFLGTETAAE